jgi:hypothetical protein
MPKLNTTRHDLFHDGQGKMFCALPVGLCEAF